MIFSVVVSDTAHRDIQRNASWWAEHHSLEQAIHWQLTVYGQIETLARMPASHGFSAENNELNFECHDKLVGLGSRPGYRAVFTIIDNTVYVLTVRSSSQDRIEPGQLNLDITDNS